ncbi:MAG: DUF3418 domain-containing protein, partial [Gammaproteobacteria bacterium]|nr:DUF3418 domain-containing protein [Gammaproteobacteria bacterium]
PGMLREKMIALLRSLPKSIRKNFVPAPNFADACMEALEASNSPLTTAMTKQLKKMTGIEIPYDAWRLDLVDGHLFMNFRIIDHNGKTLREDRDLPALKEQLADRIGSDSQLGEITLTKANAHDEKIPAHEIERDEVGAESIDLLGQTFEIKQHGLKLTAYPALVKNGKQVSLRLLNTQQQAEAETVHGLRQLFINALPQQIKHLKGNIPNIQNLCLKYADLGRCEELKQDIIDVVIEQCFMQQPIGTQAAFTSAMESGRGMIDDAVREYCQLLNEILDQYKVIKKAMKNPPLTLLDVVSDIQNQLAALFPEHFLTKIDRQWLKHYPRYLNAINKRLDKAQQDASRDRPHRLHIADLWQAYIKRHDTLEKQHLVSEQLEHYRWMLEEYRVSLFAQELKTQFPVSEKRLKTYWNEISDA